MDARTELLSGGLVTARDASLLTSGELQLAEDVMLLPGDPGLHKAFGRTSYGSGGGAITGLAYCPFDSGSDKVIAIYGGQLYSSAVTPISFGVIADNAGTTLEAVSMENKWALLTGGSVTNFVLRSDNTTRPHGLNPVTTAPALVHTATGGVFPVSNGTPGYYQYWTTEVVVSGTDVVESAFVGTPSIIQVTNTTSHVTIQRPATVNSGATHWRVYRSAKLSTALDNAFPVGFRISGTDLPIPGAAGAATGVNNFEDGLSVSQAAAFPSVQAQLSAAPGDINTIPYTSFAVNKNWTNPTSGMKADDGTLSTSDQCFSTNLFGLITHNCAMALLSTFGFTTANISEPVLSISVLVQGSRSTKASVQCALSWNAGANWTSFKGIPLPVDTIPNAVNAAVVTISSEDWGLFNTPGPGHRWTASDFSDANFRVLIAVFGAYGSGDAGLCTIDYVQVSFIHAGTGSVNPNGGLGETVQFDYITLDGSSIPRNGKPPSATTGDVFQGSIVMNDPANPTNIVWTVPDEIDYCPSLYRMALDDHNSVTCIRTLGSVCLIGTDSQVHRLNYVPLELDPEFNTGRAIDTCDVNDGIVGLKAATKFMLGSQQMLFYVGQSGLKMTNGFTTTTATDDLKWPAMVNAGTLSTCFVENNVQYHELLLFYPATGSSTPNKILRLSYHESHLKNGKLKVSGITAYGATCAASGTLTTGAKILLSAIGTAIYKENDGYVDGFNSGIYPKVTTRDIHLNGLGKDWELPQLGIHHQSGGSSAVRTTSHEANVGATTSAPESFDHDERMERIIETAQSGGGISITLEGGADDGENWDIDYLLLYANSQGTSAPIKE